jgi:HD-GYP domain-containing protein (c-di-GMP phosphodiesterase class II)
MLSRNRRRKHFLTLIATQIVCLAVGLWIHHHLIVSAAYRAAEKRALAELAANTEQLRTAISHQEPVHSLEEAEIAPAPLLAAGVIAWVWTSVLLVIAVNMIVTRFYARLEEKRTQAEEDTLRRIQLLSRTRDAVVLGLAKLADSRDQTTGYHLERISCYASRLAAELRRHPKYRDVVTTEYVQSIAIGSTLHDIGKVGIEDSILLKPGPLTAQERERVKQHAVIGGRCLLEIERCLETSNFLQMARIIAFSHHEWWDGNGYPQGLAGEQIPLSARIVAIADVYEALSSPRVYKGALPHQQCVEVIRSQAGKQFDPDLAEVFCSIAGGLRQITSQYYQIVPEGREPLPRAPALSEDHQCEDLLSTCEDLISISEGTYQDQSAPTNPPSGEGSHPFALPIKEEP